MANTQLVDTPWLDILPPPAPVDHSLFIVVVVISLLILLLAGLYAIWQRRPRQRALKRLKQLQQQLDSGSLNIKQCLFEINHLLRDGLGEHRLTSTTIQNASGWQIFYTRLSQLQYQSASPASDEARRMIDDAMSILKSVRP